MDDLSAALLGEDPATALGYLLVCAAVAPAVWLVTGWNVAAHVASVLPEAFGGVPALVFVGAILLGTATAVAYHAAANRGHLPGYAGALVVLYAAAFGFGPLNVGGGFPEPLTVYEQASRSLVVAGAVTAVVATAGVAAGVAARRAGWLPGGRFLTPIGAAVARPLPGGVTPGVVVVALLVVVSAASWAGAATTYGWSGPCVRHSSTPGVDATRTDGTLELEYDHACSVQARSLVVDTGAGRWTWASLDPGLPPTAPIPVGRNVTVPLPADGRVMLVYESPKSSQKTVLGAWNASEP